MIFEVAIQLARKLPNSLFSYNQSSVAAAAGSSLGIMYSATMTCYMLRPIVVTAPTPDKQYMKTDCQDDKSNCFFTVKNVQQKV